jgi:HSP20 family protein
MALIRWEPARELHSLQNEVNRLFGLFDAPSAGGSLASRDWIPAMDLAEDQGEYVVRADLPGVTEKDVQIELQDNVLTISGERSSEHQERKNGYYRVERASGRFSRSLTLPEGVDPQSVRAQFENGVLEVRIPKPAERKPHRVTINAGGGSQPVVDGGSAEPALAGAGTSSEGGSDQS